MVVISSIKTFITKTNVIKQNDYLMIDIIPHSQDSLTCFNEAYH